MPETMTFADFARHLNCARSYVTKLRQEGRLCLEGEGRKARVLVAESLARIKASRDPSRSPEVTAPPATGSVPLDLAPDAEGSAPEAAGGTGEEDPEEKALALNPNYQSARARRETANAARAEIELALLKGTLVAWEELEPVINNIVSVFRSSLEAMADTLSPGLAAETNEANVRNTLSEAIESILSDLSRSFSKLSKKEPAR